jgi:hypothetical protein
MFRGAHDLDSGRFMFDAEEWAELADADVGIIADCSAGFKQLAAQVAPATGARSSFGVGDVVVSGVPIDDADASSPTQQLCGSLAASIGDEDVQNELAAAHVVNPDEASLTLQLHAHRGLVREHDGQRRNADA